jgi:nucleoside-diphosphate-sugar epimerase
MNNKISVFGSTGFIGSEFCNQYPDEVILIPRDSTEPLSKKVLYLISTSDNHTMLTNSLIDVETNLIHLLKVLENCRDKDIEFTYVSSWFVYGDVLLPAAETSYCKPKGFYSITKRTAEQLIETYCKTYNIKYNIVRLGNVIGTADSKVSSKKNALQFLINELKQDKDINLYCNGEFYRDFIDVNDVAGGLKFIIDTNTFGEVYNLAFGKPTVFKDLIIYAKEKLNSKSKIGTMEVSDFHKAIYIKSMWLDTTKINNLGWNPKVNIYNTLDKIIAQ